MGVSYPWRFFLRLSQYFHADYHNKNIRRCIVCFLAFFPCRGNIWFFMPFLYILLSSIAGCWFHELTRLSWKYPNWLSEWDLYNDALIRVSTWPPQDALSWDLHETSMWDYSVVRLSRAFHETNHETFAALASAPYKKPLCETLTRVPWDILIL